MDKTANWWIYGCSLTPTFNYRLWHVFTFGQKKRLKSSYLDYRLLHVHIWRKRKGLKLWFPDTNWSGKASSLEQCLFSNRQLLSKVNQFKPCWSLLRGVTLGWFELNGMTWFSTTQGDMRANSRKLFGRAWLTMEGLSSRGILRTKVGYGRPLIGCQVPIMWSAYVMVGRSGGFINRLLVIISADNLFGLSGYGPSPGLLVWFPFCIDGFTQP
jgi:hypothetical protein